MKGMLVAVAVSLMVSGCVTTPEAIDLAYVPATDVIAAPGASEINLSVRVSDVRATTDRVASKQNIYGQNMGVISSNQDVSTLVKNALEAELRNRGFVLSDGPTQLVCEIYDFENEFQSGFWSGTAVANARMNIKIKDADGNYIFSEMIVGQGRKEKIQLASGKNAKPALDSALKNAMNNLFQRQDFYEALQRAGKRASVVPSQ